jgi:hypothetical protein
MKRAWLGIVIALPLFCVLSIAADIKNDDTMKVEQVAKLKVDAAVADAKAAVARGDRRLLAVYGIALEVPGVDADVATLRQQYGLRILEGTSDAIKGPQDRLFNDNARSYAKRYNNSIVSANAGS